MFKVENYGDSVTLRIWSFRYCGNKVAKNNDRYQFVEVEIDTVFDVRGMNFIMTKYGPTPVGKEWIAEEAFRRKWYSYLYDIDDEEGTELVVWWKDGIYSFHLDEINSPADLRFERIDENNLSNERIPDGEFPEEVKPCPTDIFLVECESAFYESKAVFSALYSFPRKIEIETFGRKYWLPRVKTLEGKVKIPLKPGFVLLPTSDAFKNTFGDYSGPFYESMIEEARAAIGDFYVRTPNGAVSYLAPWEWKIHLKNGKYTLRNNDFVVQYDIEDPYNMGKHHWKYFFNGVRGDIYAFPTLPSRQGTIYVIIEGDEAYAYGVITPEGIYTVKTTRGRLLSGKQISITDEEVELVAFHAVFPWRIGFESAYYTRKPSLGLVIDDVALRGDLMEYAESQYKMREYFEKNRITEKNADLVMEFGLKALR